MILFIEGLSENILLELYTRINLSNKSTMTTIEYLSIRKSILILIFTIRLAQ